MPITEAVAKVLSGERTPLDAIAELMRRELTSE
jgi:glycerol-3-phosphate dehydrogenase